jgi:hypothetical protein
MVLDPEIMTQNMRIVELKYPWAMKKTSHENRQPSFKQIIAKMFQTKAFLRK